MLFAVHVYNAPHLFSLDPLLVWTALQGCQCPKSLTKAEGCKVFGTQLSRANYCSYLDMLCGYDPTYLKPIIKSSSPLHGGYINFVAPGPSIS